MDRHVPLLTRYGLSPDADLVFRTLTGYGPQTAAELASALGLSNRRVHAALEELTGHGAARSVAGAGVSRPVWRALPPDAVVERLLRRRVHQAQARAAAAKRLTQLGDVTADCDLGGLAPDQVRPLYGIERVRERLGELASSVRTEHLAMQPEPVFSPEAVKAAAPHNRALLARGVTVLALGVPSALDEVAEAHTVELTSSGMQYRELPTLPAKLMVIDRTTAIVPLDPRQTGRGALEVTAPNAVAALVALFLRRWHEAHTPEPGWAAAMHLSPRERAVVSLLAAGYTDTAAAEQLGLSVRTIAYTVRGLMDRYGVQNRFQLGLVLGAITRDGPDPSTSD